MNIGWLGSAARGIATLGLRCAFILVLFEGAASLVLFTLDLPESIEPPAADRRHTSYDPELGWVNLPQLHVADLYGADRSFTTNGQRFRAAADYPARVPEGRVRLMCSGSDATLGRGVGDEATWCAQLARRDARLETVNMGQQGYGIGQTYLWYTRDGLPLDHQIHLFVFTRADFTRMQGDDFEHRAKPYLRVQGDVLRVHNLPVPRTPDRTAWLFDHTAVLDGLRSVQLVRPVVEALLPAQDTTLTAGELADLAVRVFESLADVHEARGSRLLLVYLPTLEDYDAPRDVWRRRIRAASRRLGIPMIDLVQELKALPRREVGALYRRNGHSEARDWNELGHAWIAKALMGHLTLLPELAGESVVEP